MFQFIGFIILVITNLIAMLLSFVLTIIMLPFYLIGFLLAVIGIKMDEDNHQNRIKY
jgi:prepilin signal peptidase PulO-like enzyme (type II secretory pathway)